MAALLYRTALALGLICFFLRASASPRGRGLNQAVASATASSLGGSSTAVATSISTGGGTAVSEVNSKSTGGGNAFGSQTSVAKDGGTAVGSLDVEATRGADVSADLTIVAEEDAKAFVDKVVAADGDQAFAIDSFVKAINIGDGNLIRLVLNDSYSRGVMIGDFLAEAVYIAVRDVVDADPENTSTIESTFTSALSESTPGAVHFGEVLSRIVKELGCDYIKPVLVASEAAAALAGTDRAYIESITDFEEVVTCVYSSPCVEPMLSACCVEAARAIGLCECTPGTTDGCSHHLFWQVPTMIWNCISPTCEEDVKCICPVA